ncbi:hypothetical protein KY284_001271 [Solanum tuberosum]|nr:hypothetical protein KY284_001271 [Solanum tuberosum]
MEDLLSLSRGPTKYSTHSNGYIINGYIFYIEDHDQMLRTQNCGVVVVGENDKDSENVDYYRILTDVIELQFISNRRMILFHCNWFDVYAKIKGIKRYEYDFVIVNPSRFLKINEPFVLVNQASQVFYASDNSNKGWHVVRKTQRRDSYEMGKQMDDEDVVVDLESAIGKGQGTGHKNSTMSSSQVPTPFRSSTNQVKKCTEEVETRVYENIVKSSQGLPTIDKNILVLEKENTQAKSPSSIDQVMQPSQTTETGSSNPRKDKFESVDLNDHRDHIFGWMNELWNKWRGYLHVTYVKNKPIVQALKNIPKGVEKKEWEWLVKEHFCSESFQILKFYITIHARSNRNAENRAKLKMYHHIGSKPLERLFISRYYRKITILKKIFKKFYLTRFLFDVKGGKDGNPPNLATIFFETRKKDNMVVEPEAIEKHVRLAQIEEILKVEPSLPSIEIVEKCCEPQTRSHVFGFGGGVKAKDMIGGTSSKTELLSQLRSTQEEN